MAEKKQTNDRTVSNKRNYTCATAPASHQSCIFNQFFSPYTHFLIPNIHTRPNQNSIKNPNPTRKDTRVKEAAGSRRLTSHIVSLSLALCAPQMCTLRELRSICIYRSCRVERRRVRLNNAVKVSGCASDDAGYIRKSSGVKDTSIYP